MKLQEPIDKELQIPDVLPVVLVRDIVVFPFVIFPISIAHEMAISSVESALAGNRMVILLGHKNPSEQPNEENAYRVGTVATIMRMLKLPDGRMRILVQGVSRCKIEYFTGWEPHAAGKIHALRDLEQRDNKLEQEALMRSMKVQLERIASMGRAVASEVLVLAANMDDPGRLADLVASNVDLKKDEGQTVLEELNVYSRLKLVNEILSREATLLEMQQHIDNLARGEMDRSQRDFYLRQQLKVIQSELGETNELQDEINGYRSKMEKLVLTDEARDEINKQLRRLENMHPDTAETGLIRTYLDWVTELPWGNYSQDKPGPETRQGPAG